MFAGHPNLIQGFNTFLPPGYRIECGAGNDPNTIRVTTPMGTTVQSIAGRGPIQGDAHAQNSGRNPFFNHRPGGWPQQPAPANDGEAAFTGHPPGAAGTPYQGQGQGPPFEAGGSAQRPGGPSTQAQNPAVPVAAPGPRNVHTPPSAAAAAAAGSVNGAAAQLAGQEKRGPVEFNHAISYVNKIKVCWSGPVCPRCETTRMS
ncbi:hypothetical protein IMZ48_18220 [Candidatus Bathyarchaeota archaeon]|nr:hypothetical protein [Candidatus Bathyarchaeota archaeon]